MMLVMSNLATLASEEDKHSIESNVKGKSTSFPHMMKHESLYHCDLANKKV